MAKKDGWAEVTLQVFDEPKSFESLGFQVIINHFESKPEIWDTFKTEQEAREEAVRWNSKNNKLTIQLLNKTKKI